MISVTSEMIFKSVIFSAVLGSISGLFHALLLLIVSCVLRLLHTEFPGKKICREKHGLLHHAVDFLLIMTMVVIYLLGGYAFLDGAYEIYSLSAMMITYVLFNRFFSTVFGVSI